MSAGSLSVVDALGRIVRLEKPAERVVSLVPSETASVADLVGVQRLVGRTAYCEEPRGAVESVATCGGTKNIDIAQIVSLKPDLILANQEENSKKEVTKLIELGLPVHVSFPQTLADSRNFLSSLCTLLGSDEAAPSIRAVDEAMQTANELRRQSDIGVFVPIWMDPLMTFDRRTFASSMLLAAGAQNVFADRARRYPLAADVGDSEPLTSEQLADRDTRYPRVTLAEVVARRPSAILLPDEPHPFSAADEEVFRSLNTPATATHQVIQVDGKDLFWYGTRVGPALIRLCARIAGLVAAA